MPSQPFISVRWLLGAVALGLMIAVATAQEKKDDKDSADKDYAAELPRIPATEPADALKTFSVAKGFELQLVAAEPLVADPIAIAFDEFERMYVVEMRGYSEQRDENLSRIRRLEDRDGDGKYETSTIFAEGLKWPTAIACWDGGVFVGDAPDLFYLKDTNGDGKSDTRHEIFGGFALSNVQGLMNSFQWSFDNRIYGSTSSTGAEVTRPGDMQFKLPIRGRDFALEPKSLTITPTTGGAQHGLSLDDWGDRFVCHNSDHLQQVLYEDRYLARNPYLAAPAARKSIAADGPQADVFRTSQVEPWRIVRTRLRVKGIVPGIVEGGGRAAGYFTSATGVTIYRGDAWPAEARGWAIVGDVGSNIVHRKRLEDLGIEYRGVRMDEKSEFIASRDNWFRPVQFANAPDGNLWICDMYRETIEHPASIPPIIKKHLDLTSGRDRGRIWRIAQTGYQYQSRKKPGEMTTIELVGLLEHPNGWHRDTASRLLYTRQDLKAVGPLEELAAKSQTPLGRMHALYALQGLGALSPDVLAPRLADEHPRVRQHAIRLSESLAATSPVLRDKLLTLATDRDARVRLQLAFSAGELTSESKIAVLNALASASGDQSHIRTALMSSLRDGAGDLFATLIADKERRSTSSGIALLRDLATQIGKQQAAADVALVAFGLTKLPKDETATWRAVLESLAAKPGTKLAQQLAAVSGGTSEAMLRDLVAQANAVVKDDKATIADRVVALRQMRLGSFEQQSKLLDELLQPTQPAEIQSASLATLASFGDEAADVLLSRMEAMAPKLKSQALDALLSRPASAKKTLDAVTAGKLPPGDIDSARLKLLADGSDAQVSAVAKKLLAGLQIGPRAEVFARYKPVLDSKGDVAKGKVVFQKNCAPCHKLQGVGHELGPNLAAMKNRGAEAILLNVLDPNREVLPQFLNYTVVLQDGRTLNGVIVGETATSITLKRGDNATDTVLRIDIEKLKSTGQSIMPEGLEKQISPEAMTDLLDYLKSLE